MDRHRTVIIGGGFGGLAAAHGLRRVSTDVTLIDRRNFHVFQPLLYQVATGGLSPANISSTLRWILRKQSNTRVLLGEVKDLDLSDRNVVLENGDTIPFDSLIVATGAKTSYFGNDHWAARAPGLKTIEDATEIRQRIYRAFEAAEREEDAKIREELLTFVVVGAGPTGVELAGALSEIARYTVRSEFRRIDTAKANVILVDAADRVLPSYPKELSRKSARSLEKLGVTIRLGAMVTSVRETEITMKAEDKEVITPTRTVLWAAGVRATAPGRTLESKTGARTDRGGRVIVEPNLTVPGHPEIFVIGDLANFSHQGVHPLPGLAPVAQQQGRYVARTIKHRLAGKEVEPFRYKDRGQMATIGRAAAVADLGWLRMSGIPAWLTWLFIHLMYIVEFENRVLVFIQWAWSYMTWNRGARLIAHGHNPEAKPRNR